MNKYPKVLIVSHNIFEDTNNIGKTLVSLLNGWPKDRLCQVYLRDEAPTFNFCDDYFCITDRQIVKSYYKGRKGVGTAYTSKDKICIEHDNKESKDQSFYNLGNKRIPVISLLRDLVWTIKSWNNSAFNDWLIAQKPDVILFVPNDYALIYPIVNHVSKKLNIPVVPYYMDDAFYFDAFVGPIDYLRRLCIRAKGRKVIKNTKTILTIGPKMSEKYEKCFKKRCDELMNSVVLNNGLVKQESISKNFNICYVGNLHSNRWKTILKLGKAFDSLKKNAVINVYTASILSKKVLKKFEQTKSIHLCGKLSPSEVPSILSKADALLFVESFDRKSVASTMYSLSTKIPEYLNSLRPILAIGPRNISSVEYLKCNNIAVVCDSFSNIEPCIEKIINFNEWYNPEQIRKFVLEHHDLEKNRELMKNVIFDSLK